MTAADRIFFDSNYEVIFPKVTRFVASNCGCLADVEDIVQDVFIELVGILDKKGAAYICNIEAFCIGIARFHLNKYYRRKKNNAESICDDTENLAVTDNIEVDAIFINAATVNEVWRAINKKDSCVQRIFALHYYCGLTIAEVADTLNLSQSAVKHKLYRTLSGLRKLYT